MQMPLRTQMPLRAVAPRRKAPWTALLPALAAGLAAAGLAFLLVRGRLPAEAAAAPMVTVVAAARDIPARTLLSASALGLRSIPTSEVPDGAAKSVSAFVGKVSVQPISAGTALTESAVCVPSAALGMAFALPPTLRAVTVATDPADGVELFVRPEDHVDILATDEPGAGPAEARTVLQNVRLLAVGGQTSPDPPAASASSGGAAHVTVAVSPAQAQALVLAAARGHLHLALRAIGDGSEAALPPLPAPAAAALHQLAPRLPHHRADRVPPIKSEPVKSAPGIGPLPPLPVLSVAPPPVPAPSHVTITVVKGTQSQTMTVAP